MSCRMLTKVIRLCLAVPSHHRQDATPGLYEVLLVAANPPFHLYSV